MSRAFVCIAMASLLWAAPAPGKEKDPAGKALTPQQELQRLLREGNVRARDQVEAGIEFLPYAYVKLRDGSVRVVDPPRQMKRQANERVPDEAFADLLEKLEEERKASGGFRAVAIFTDDEVKIEGRKTFAVQAGLEHESGFCLDVFTPYRRMARGEVVHRKAVSSQRPEGLILDCKQGEE